MSPTAATVLKPAKESQSTPAEAELDVTIHTQIQEAAEDWRQLAKTGFGNPYQTPDWLGAWSRTLGDERHIEPVIVVGRLQGKPVVVLPLGLQRTAGTATLSFLGHGHGNQNTGIWDPRFYADVSDEMMRMLLTDVCTERRADMLVLQNVPGDWQG